MLVQDITLKLNNITDKIIMGPQGEILEAVNRFNESYDTNVKVTKTFRWSPGIYDELKKAISKYYLSWDRRCNKVDSLFSRMDNQTWAKRQLQNSICRINTMMTDKRDQGLVFQENKEEIKEYFQLFLNRIIEFSEYKHDRVKITMEINDTIVENFNNGELNDMIIKTKIKIDPEHISIGVWEHEDNSIIHITDLYTPYTITLQYRFSFIKWFNSFCSSQQNGGDINRIHNIIALQGHNTYNRRDSVGGHIVDNNENNFLSFPYISSHRSNGLGAICLGDLQDMIYTYLFNLNSLMFYDMVYKWATTFIVHKSNPYNRIYLSFHGHPKGISKDDMQILGGRGTTEGCTYPGYIQNALQDGNSEIIKDSYCDRSECTLRNKCEYYNNVISGEVKVSKRYNLRPNQRSSPMPSWMAQDENGIWRDTRQTSDMQVESDMVSNDGGELADRDGES